MNFAPSIAFVRASIHSVHIYSQFPHIRTTVGVYVMRLVLLTKRGPLTAGSVALTTPRVSGQVSLKPVSH